MDRSVGQELWPLAEGDSHGDPTAGGLANLYPNLFLLLPRIFFQGLLLATHTWEPERGSIDASLPRTQQVENRGE